MKVCLSLLFLLLFTSCAHMKSGHFVKLTKSDNVEDIAHSYGVSPAAILNANKGKKLQAGEWIFIPLNRGISQIFQDNVFYDGDVEYSQEFLTTGKFLWPVPSSTRISSNYGRRGGRPHDGVDIPAREGASILAADDGVVVHSGRGLQGYGNLTVIRHSHGYFTVYAHAQKNYTRKGQKVFRGQVIAQVGSTGRSTGPHLHFEIRREGKSLNPIAFIQHSRRYLVAKGN